MTEKISQAYERIGSLIARQQCVILDGGVTTELERIGMQDHHISDQGLWGTWALYHMPHLVLEVHRRYAQDAECDVISTNTWAILGAPEIEATTQVGPEGPTHWMDAGRLAVRLARQAIEQAGRTGHCAVAFSINGDINNPQRQDTLGLLTRVFDQDPPDLILMETLSLIREDLTYPAVQTMLDTGLPVWLSFRRCRHGVCGVHGQHWGGPEGDQFGRAARRFEDMGVSALLINCLPADHVPGMLPWLRDFTDMPLGVYPNLGRYIDPGWKFDDSIGPREYGRMALDWRREGAQIVGGCCGVTCEHLAAARQNLVDTRPGRPKVSPAPEHAAPPTDRQPTTQPVVRPWSDSESRPLYPLAVPELRLEPDVFEPTEGSFLLWKHLFSNGTGRDKKCLDVGCGSGILSIQLALNGADSVEAVDIQREAVANTMANAFRNGVETCIHGTVDDVYTFTPAVRYDLIVASMYQMPVDPYGEITGHRPVDYWGRNLLDHLIAILPNVLTDEGEALLLQLSILSQMRTHELLEEAGLEARVIDFDTFPFSPAFIENFEQIQRVEQISDAYHLSFGRQNVMVAYLLQITKKRD